jgi:hypothetical protein
MIRCVHLSTGSDGRSHVEEITLPSGLAQDASVVHF